jgi:DNA polymerase III sliding clamp (beta) subunit (PCNA family)
MACKLAKLRLSGEFTELQQVEGDFLQIEGELYPEFTGANFPNYKVVMPDYENYMAFDRAEMMQEIKKVLPSANRSTNQVSFHLNGSIELAAQDVDFSFESTGKLPYIKKTFPDTDIAFNGKMFCECLAAFKDSTLKMYTEGRPDRCILLQNSNETVLLMPLLLNR